MLFSLLHIENQKSINDDPLYCILYSQVLTQVNKVPFQLSNKNPRQIGVCFNLEMIRTLGPGFGD